MVYYRSLLVISHDNLQCPFFDAFLLITCYVISLCPAKSMYQGLLGMRFFGVFLSPHAVTSPDLALLYPPAENVPHYIYSLIQLMERQTKVSGHTVPVLSKLGCHMVAKFRFFWARSCGNMLNDKDKACIQTVKVFSVSIMDILWTCGDCGWKWGKWNGLHLVLA